MKEYVHYTGGRQLKGDDLKAIQAIALMAETFFAQFGSFIISGCEPDENNATISSGIVMLNGKACTFKGENNVTFPFYVKYKMTTETVPYESGEGDGIGYEIHQAIKAVASDEGAFQLDNAPRFADIFKPKNAERAGDADTLDGKHATAFLEKAGGDMSQGKEVGFVPNSSGSSAVGVAYKNKSGAKVAGTGATFSNGEFNSLYMGWGNNPSGTANSLNVSDKRITYKNNDVWHKDGDMPITPLLMYLNSQIEGVLIKLDISEKVTERVILVNINAFAYIKKEIIDTDIYFYIDNLGTVQYKAALNKGLNIPKVNVFFYEGYLHLWFEGVTGYSPTVNVWASTNRSVYNMAMDITNSAMPTAGVDRLTEIIPKQAVVNDLRENINVRSVMAKGRKTIDLISSNFVSSLASVAINKYDSIYIVDTIATDMKLQLVIEKADGTKASLTSNFNNELGSYSYIDFGKEVLIVNRVNKPIYLVDYVKNSTSEQFKIDSYSVARVLLQPWGVGAIINHVEQSKMWQYS